MNPSFDINERFLEWRKFGVSSAVSKELVEDASVSEVYDHMFDQMVYRMTKFVLGEKIPSMTVKDIQKIESPKNPWQHFKMMYVDKWFMRRLVQKWPVKYDIKYIELTTTWNQYILYPWQKHILKKDMGQPVRIIEEPQHVIKTLSNIE